MHNTDLHTRIYLIPPRPSQTGLYGAGQTEAFSAALMWRHTCAKMAETGTEAGTGYQRAAAPHQASEIPEFKSTIGLPIWKKEALRSVQGTVEKENIPRFWKETGI